MNKKDYLVVFSIHESSSKFGDVVTSILGTSSFRSKFVRYYIRDVLADADGKIECKDAKRLLRYFKKWAKRPDLFVVKRGEISFTPDAETEFGDLCNEFCEMTDQNIGVSMSLHTVKEIQELFESLPSCA